MLIKCCQCGEMKHDCCPDEGDGGWWCLDCIAKWENENQQNWADGSTLKPAISQAAREAAASEMGEGHYPENPGIHVQRAIDKAVAEARQVIAKPVGEVASVAGEKASPGITRRAHETWQQVLALNAVEGPSLKHALEIQRAIDDAVASATGPLVEALYESMALNENWSADAEPETLAYYSEYRKVIALAKAALAVHGGG